jgi:CheY-like chemotaxis protein
MAVSKESELFQKFIATRKILIADESSSARSGVFAIFSKLGVKPFQISLASSLPDAEAEIIKSKPDIVIAEFNFGKHCGLDLLQRQRANNPDVKKSIFLLLTSNSSQSAVARAAEEDCDAFILKPFTPEVFRNTLIRAALLKANPPEYFTCIEAGKAKIALKDFEGAEVEFKKAEKMDPQPALACYYLGQLKLLKKIMDGAQDFYEQGLGYNKIHYKCLVGLYELLMEMKMYKEAYDVVKKVSQYFPANPKRLAEVLRLAIINQSYDDVEKYYSIFCNIDERNDMLVNYICAALVVCGKYYIRSGNRARALELFQKTVATGAGRTKFLREIIQTLVESKLATEADQILKRYPPELQKDSEYLLLNFQVQNLTLAPQLVLSRGRELMAQGIESERFYEIMLERSLEVKNERMMETVLAGCVKKYPIIHAKFNTAYEGLLGSKQEKKEASSK